MLIPVNPSKNLAKASKPERDEGDVHLEVIPWRVQGEKKVGRARVTGRTVILNRKGP
jgi:hypothetical protein